MYRKRSINEQESENASENDENSKKAKTDTAENVVLSQNSAQHFFGDESFVFESPQPKPTVSLVDKSALFSDTFCFDLEESLRMPTELSNIFLNDTLFEIPSKQTADAQERNQNDDFYGLPKKVKIMINKFRGIDQLYQWQDECLKLKAVKERTNLIYALPTSGGKTLVAEILMLREIICNKKNAIFILPYVAIVQEKIQALAPFALELGFLVEEYAGGKGSYPPKKRRRKNSVYVCTIEKALGLINSLIEINRLDEIGNIVVDELHLIGENGGRGATLEVLLTKVVYLKKQIHIVGMSATIGNLEEIASFLKAELYVQNFRPIEIQEYVKCDNYIYLVDHSKDDVFVDRKKVQYRYSEEASKLDPDRIGGLVTDVAPQDSCLIFCSNRKGCENVAILLTRVLNRSFKEHKSEEKKRLLNHLKAETDLCPVLSKTIPFGIAYHHSGLTSEERKLLEDAFRDGVLCVICCTSTLAAGVNLPARRVILRSPYIGNQFMTIGRYKQMIGRAGRAGMGSIGESILIMKDAEGFKVKELLSSRMDDCLSSLHTEGDRGIYNLLLSAVLLSIASTRSELHQLASHTLLSIQQKKLNVDLKSIVDDTISTLIKQKIIKVAATDNYNAQQQVDVLIKSQMSSEDAPVQSSVRQRIVTVDKHTKFELCDLGRAAMKACIDLQTAYILYDDLKMAQKNLNLLDHFHLLYLVTPYEVTNQIKPVASVFYDTALKLSENQMDVLRLLGLNEAVMGKIRDGFTPKNVQPRIINRMYVTLILYDLWCQKPIFQIATKYQVGRGIVQNLLQTTAAFTSSVVRFCEELSEFWAFKDLLTPFGQRIMYCCTIELEPLMELPSVKIGRAKQLYKAGYKNLQSIAKATTQEIRDKVEHIPANVVKQIIATANLLILEKVENLRDEAEDVLDGIDLKNLI